MGLFATTTWAMDTLSKLLGPQIQLGFVVRDMNAALGFWTREMGIGPFIVFEHSLGTRRFVHRGQVSDVHMSVALAYRGDTQIELISQSNSAPSMYSEFFAGGGEGLQHIAFAADDYPLACRTLEAKGFVEISSIQMTDGTKNVSYFASPRHFGAVVEVVPMTPARRAYYGRIKELAATWDGHTRPIRRFRDNTEFLASPDFRNTTGG